MNNTELRIYQERHLPQNDSQALQAIEDIGPYLKGIYTTILLKKKYLLSRDKKMNVYDAFNEFIEYALQNLK